MNKLLVVLAGCLITLTSMAANPYLDNLTKDELIEKLTRNIPIKDNIYSCSQVVYNYSLLKEAVNSCGFSRLSSASDTGNVMCHSWATMKSDGSFVKIRSIAKQAETDFNEQYSKSQKKDETCSKLLNMYSDFIVK